MRVVGRDTHSHAADISYIPCKEHILYTYALNRSKYPLYSQRSGRAVRPGHPAVQDGPYGTLGTSLATARRKQFDGNPNDPAQVLSPTQKRLAKRLFAPYSLSDGAQARFLRI
jgi:hypothetical protein